MTPQEQQLLEGLTDRVNQTVLSEKDPDAEQFIQQALGRNPDALYILAQTVLVQQYALEQAKKQLEDAKQQAQQQAQQPKHATSFLGNLLGLNDEPQRSAPPPPPPQYSPVNNPSAQYGAGQYAQPGYGQAAYAQPAGGGFLRSAMQTATGVAAGALAFEGIESLMHGFGEHAGYGQGFGGGGFGGRPEEVINNNYYGDSGAGGSAADRGDLADRFAADGDQASPDIEDRRDDSFADTSGADDSLANNDQDDFGSSDSSDSYDSSSDSGGDLSS